MTRAARVWLVARERASGQPFEVRHVCLTERDAVERCVAPWYFVGPLVVDAPLPISAGTWPGSYFPRVAKL